MAAPGAGSTRRVWTLTGALLVAAAGLAAWLAPYYAPWRWPLVAALGILGAFTLLLSRERVVPEEALEAALEGDAAATASVLEALELSGPGTYVPPTGNLERDGLFVAAEPDAEDLPRLVPDRRTYRRGADGADGALLDPAGRAVVDAYERDQGVSFAGSSLSQAFQLLSGLGPAVGLFRGFSATQRQEAIRVEHTPQAETPCWADPEPTCLHAGCLACSAIGVALSRALGRPLRTRSVRRVGDVVVLQMVPARVPSGGVA